MTSSWQALLAALIGAVLAMATHPATASPSSGGARDPAAVCPIAGKTEAPLTLQPGCSGPPTSPSCADPR